MKKTVQSTDSLARSHSGRSNARLTLLCILAALSFGGFFAGLGLYGAISAGICLPVILVSGLLCVLCLCLFAGFRR